MKYAPCIDLDAKITVVEITEANPCPCGAHVVLMREKDHPKKRGKCRERQMVTSTIRENKVKKKNCSGQCWVDGLTF